MNDRHDGAAEHFPTHDASGEFSPLDTTPSLEQTTSAPAGARNSGVWPVLREVIETVLLTLVIFLLIRTVVQNFRVDGMSMEPNFHDGQFLLINKLAYRLGEPQRGDVIVFRYPRDPSRDFIKRVIGLPGETVDIIDGQVYINGQPLADFPDVQRAAYTSSTTVLGPDELFVMGDNRPNSSDSHSWGPLAQDLVIGKVVLSYWPPSTWGLIKTPVDENAGGAVSADTSQP